MEIAKSPTRERFPLSPKKITKKTITGSCGCCIALLFLGGIGISILIGAMAESGKSDTSIIIWAIVAFIVVVLLGIIPNYYYQKWYFAVYYYELGQDYIVIRKGPITPKEITIPYERVQDVYMDQDILDRMMGLYDVHLSSATISSGMEAHIDGLEKEAAEGLRALLLQTVSTKIAQARAHGQQGQAVPPPPPIMQK